MAVVGVLGDDVDPMVSVMKLEKAPTESYADIGGLEQQIQEIKVSAIWFMGLKSKEMEPNYRLDSFAGYTVSLLYTTILT